MFPPVSMGDVLVDLAGLTDDQYSVLEASVFSVDAFSTDPVRCELLGSKLGLDGEAAGLLLSLIDFLDNETNSRGASERERTDAIDRLIRTIFEKSEEESDDQFFQTVDRLRERLIRLTAKNPDAEFRRKIWRLKKGFVPNALSFASFIDLRPVIADDRSRIAGYVTVIQFKIVTGIGEDEKETVIQLDERSLTKLSEAVADAQKKLALVASDSAFSSKLLDQS